VAGLAPPAGAGRAAPRPSRTPKPSLQSLQASGKMTPPRYLLSHRSAGRCPSASPRGNPDGSCAYTGRVRGTPPRCLLSHRSEGRCPSASPRGNPDGSPRPLRSPPWSPASGGEDVVGSSDGCGACLRCEGCMAASANGPLAAHGRRHVSAFRVSARFWDKQKRCLY
jgi:hypothetical protein